MHPLELKLIKNDVSCALPVLEEMSVNVPAQNRWNLKATFFIGGVALTALAAGLICSRYTRLSKPSMVPVLQANSFRCTKFSKFSTLVHIPKRGMIGHEVHQEKSEVISYYNTLKFGTEFLARGWITERDEKTQTPATFRFDTIDPQSLRHSPAPPFDVSGLEVVEEYLRSRGYY